MWRLSLMAVDKKLSNVGWRPFGMVIQVNFLRLIFLLDNGRLGKVMGAKVETTSNNENVISDDLNLSQIFNNYFESAIGKLEIKECHASSEVNANYRSKDGVDVAVEKYKDRPSIKMINKDVLFESRFSIKVIRKSDLENVASNLNSKKAGTFENIPTKVLYRHASVLPCVSKVVERINQKQFLSFKDEFLFPYLCAIGKKHPICYSITY